MPHRNHADAPAISDNPAFDQAYQQFLQSLSEQERRHYSPCASTDDLLDGLKKLDILSKQRQRRRSTRFIACIQKFSDRLRPYFDVIQTFIQSNPKYAALVWGALQLVLELASNFVTFFEKLVKFLERLADVLPQCEQIARLCQNLCSTRMKSHLEAVYIDLFRFFQSAARVFTKEDGSIKKTPMVLSSILWTPFDARFKDLLEEMKYHQRLVQAEFILLQAQAANDAESAASQERYLAAEERKRSEEARKRTGQVLGQTEEARRLLEEEHKRAACSRIQTWLSPPAFAEVLHKSQELREDNTNGWIFENPTFKDWRYSDWLVKPDPRDRSMGAKTLWVHGNPGSGKTVLASSVIEEFQQDIDTHNVVYFFFKSDDVRQRDPAAAYRSVLAQILQLHRQNQDIIDKFAFAHEASEGSLSATSGELVELFQMCLQDLGHVYLILDGIDECDDNPSLIRNLRWIAGHCSAKILLFSRLNVASLSRMVPKDFRLAVDRTSTNGDIRLYLTSQINQMIDEDLLLPVEETSSLVDHLVRGADGMFLWARLMISFLRLPYLLTPAHRLRAIKDVTMPEGLENMYNRILDLINGAGQTQRDLARRVIVWLTYSIRPLTGRQLYEALEGVDIGPADNGPSQFHHWAEAVILACGGLIERYLLDSGNQFTTASEPCFRFIHLSVREHLEHIGHAFRAKEGIQSLIPPKSVANLKLTTSCLQSLISHAPQQPPPPLSGIGNKRACALISFAGYAASNWMFHLAHTACDADFSEMTTSSSVHDDALKLASTCRTFLGNPLVVSAWLETCYYSIRPLPPPQLQPIEEWAVWAAQRPEQLPVSTALRNLSQSLLEFVRDMNKFIDVWGFKLTKSPPIIWDEAPAFANSRFLTPSSTTDVSYLVPKRLESEEISSRPLCTISATASDGRFNGVLSIWPSKAYERRWKDLNSQESYSSMRHLCGGWIARYEAYTIKNKAARVADIKLPLDESEVWLQMRQSFRQEYTDSWKTSFPLVISGDTHSFVVLRTLYTLQPATDSSPALWRSVIIPMDFSKAVSDKWSDDLEVFDPHKESIRNLPPALQFLHRSMYQYSFSFSSNGRFLFFSDSCQDLFIYSQVAVFEIQNKHQLDVRVVAAGTIGSRQWGLIDKVAFHPTFPLLVMCNGGFVNLWNFEKGIEEMILLEYDESMRFRRFETIVFSACGRYIVATTKNTSIVIPIPGKELQAFLADSVDTITREESEVNQGEIAHVGCLDVSAFHFRPGQVLQSGYLASQGDGQASQVITLLADEQLQVNLTSDDCQELVQSLELVELPNFPGLEKTTPVLKMPDTIEDPVRVIMNKTAQKGYSLTEPQDERLPLIFDRNSRNIQHTVSIRGTREDPSKRKAEDALIPQGLGTAPIMNRVVGLGADKITRAFDSAVASNLSDEPATKRIKILGSLP